MRTLKPRGLSKPHVNSAVPNNPFARRFINSSMPVATSIKSSSAQVNNLDAVFDFDHKVRGGPKDPFEDDAWDWDESNVLQLLNEGYDHIKRI
jgi:hypothetical protein